MEPEKSLHQEHDGGPNIDGEEMETECGAETAPTVESVESKVPCKQKSIAWDNLKTDNRNKAKCNHCGSLVSIRSALGVNTTTMLKHMSRCKELHPELEEIDIVAGKR